MTDEYSLWYAMAEEDYKVAEYLSTHYYPTPYNIICYHCQQAAEKAIKAIYIFLQPQQSIPKVHDLSFLLEQMKNMVRIPDSIYDAADSLTPFGIAARYPNELALDAGNVKFALKCAKKILGWSKSSYYKD